MALVSRWDPPETDEVLDARPYDYGGAKRAAARQSRDQAQSQEQVASDARNAAEKERLYRMALAKEILRLHAKGVAWTSAQDLARGEEEVARLKYDRDVAQGMKEAAEIGAWKCSANRKTLDLLIGWSMRVEAV